MRPEAITAGLDGVDRLCVDGRRGTGKSTAVKLWIAEGRSVIWLQRTKELTAMTPDVFVPPAVSAVLPRPELVNGGAFPLFRFGAGYVQCYPVRMADALKQTGVAVGGRQADAVIHDEYIRTDGRYIRNEPESLDSFAQTAGRSGVMPPVICLGNPLPDGSNRCPYSYSWRTNLDVEGVYDDRSGRLTRVIGTAGCRDCYGKIVGVDAGQNRYCQHISSGGFVVRCDDVYLRIRYIGRGCCICLADPEPSAPIWYARGRWTMTVKTMAHLKTLYHLRQLDAERLIVYDSFEAESAFYRLIRISS